MRIGILTLPLHTNYGGILQAYALQTVLERMGHEVVVFDTPNQLSLPPIWKRPLCYAKRAILKASGKIDRIFIEQYNNKKKAVISQKVQPFIDKYIHRKIIRNFLELKSTDYDAVVVGSDQIWRTIYFQMWNNGHIANAYLEFAKEWDVKRISYAASFGTDEWEYTDEQTLECKDLLKLFDAISVRETNGVILCKKHFNVDAIHVLDPTLLLKEKDYLKLFQKGNTLKSNGTLLNYILDETENTQSLILKVANKKNLKLFSVNNPFENDETKVLNERIKPSVETWLRGFWNAEFVVTDSFHACVFSILFRKQFAVIGNKQRGISRIKSLLKSFDLECRLVENSAQIMQLPQINYEAIYSKLEKYRAMSFDFLNTALS